MRARQFFAILSAFALSGCIVVGPVGGPRPTREAPQPVAQVSKNRSSDNFRTVMDRMEPMAEEYCRNNSRNRNCDFKIMLVTDPNQQPNAYYTRDRSGRPVIVFTKTLLRELRNAHEIAFVFGHEASHHIAGHMDKLRKDALVGGVLSGVIAAAAGADARTAEQIQKYGAAVGARQYSKDYELEADRLGAVLTYRAGYDPLRGVDFFTRAVDPGDRLLGTHPANGARIETVRRTVARMSAR